MLAWWGTSHGDGDLGVRSNVTCSHLGFKTARGDAAGAAAGELIGDKSKKGDLTFLFLVTKFPDDGGMICGGDGGYHSVLRRCWET